MLIVTLVLITSKAKYKNIQSIDLASGTINYSPADIDVVAINIENDSEEYESSTTIPSNGYTLSNDSYCNVNGEKDTSIKLTYENGKVGVSDVSKKIKCYLYFDKVVSAIDKIIGDTTNIEEKISFTGIATASDTGVYSAPDDYGTSYYFRGVENQLNNWVKFAGFYWRIIRVNGNGTIRMIYSGIANGLPSSSNKTGTVQTGSSGYNSSSDDNTGVGYMKSLNGSGITNSYEEAHTNIYDSHIKSQADYWYKTNIEDKGLNKYVDINTGFCNDRQIDKVTHSDYTGNGYGTQESAYAPWGRMMANEVWETTQTPTLQCSNKSRDLFTYTSANNGNKKLTYPVGLITSDEAIFAGAFGGADNITYYLYTSKNYWTMSPYSYNRSGACVFIISGSGKPFGPFVHEANKGIRPVINLRSDTKFTGTGNESDPFVVVEY